MKLKEFYINSNQGSKIIIGSLLIAMTFNFQGLADWANSKDVSSFTVLLVKLAQALNDFGDDVKLNTMRSKVRTAFLDYKAGRFEFHTPMPSKKSLVVLEPMTVKQATEGLNSNVSSSAQVNPEKQLPAKIEGAIYPSREDAPFAKQQNAPNKESKAPADRVDITVKGDSKETAATDFLGRNPAALPNPSEILAPVKKIDTTSAIVSEAGLNNRVLVLGDSMLKSGIQVHIKSYFSKKFPQVEIDIDSQSGTGLSRPEVFNWTDRLREKKGKYDYIVIMLGTNDAQNFAFGKKVVSFGTEAWDQEYNNRVKILTQLACEKSHKVFWVGNIQMKSEKFNEKMKRLHGVAKSALPTATCAEYVSPEKWVSDGDKYVDHINVKKKNGIVKNVKVRTEDGIHLSFEGAELFAKKLIEKVSYGTN